MVAVQIYTKATCPYCVAAKQLLERKGVNYQEFNVLTLSQDELDSLNVRTNNYRTVPRIFIGDAFIGGFDNLNKLEKDGKLDVLLNA